jgi:hypothetical protein
MRRIVLAGSLAVAVLAGGVAALVTRDGGGTASLSALPAPAGETTTSPTPPESPAPSESPTPSETPSPTASTTPKPKPTRTSESPAAVATYTDYGPRPPGSVTVPYRAGQTSWDVTSGGIRFRVSMTPAKVGVPMTWTISTSGPAGCCAVGILYGDGYGDPDNGLPCDDKDPTVSYTHVYNGSGRREFMAQAVGSCGRGEETAAVYGAFDIAPGTPSAQGPHLPVVKFDSSTPVKGHEGDHSYVSLWGEADDRDGYLTKLVVSFGDGTSKTFDGDGNKCQQGMDGWPAYSHAMLPYDPPAYHHYTKPGTYTLTLTAYSYSCDGKQQQTGKASFQWVVPEPEPTATPTG